MRIDCKIKNDKKDRASAPDTLSFYLEVFMKSMKSSL